MQTFAEGNMRYLRGLTDQNEVIFCRLDENEPGKAVVLAGDFLDGAPETDRTLLLRDIRILPPVVPSKIIAVGLNYYDHIKEFGDRPVPENPTLFNKMPHTVIGHGDAIISHPFSSRIDFEGEMAIVISGHCKDVKAENAKDYIFGVTCLNDVTARDLQRADGQWTRGKNLETFCPIGPCVATGLDIGNLHIQTRLNGKIMQDSTTSLMMNGAERLIEFISQSFPLEKGDVISTGTPKGVGPMVRGDVVEVELEGVGTLANIMK
jgi:2-keto-4-pentenoate hydratase/2-oxohepta-3-ene-1,7-dioic acid hydratase in catechol pathway